MLVSKLEELERRKHRCMRNGLLTPSTKDLINDLLAALRESEQMLKVIISEAADSNEENVRLRDAIEAAPHSSDCSGGYIFSPTTTPCNCWKRQALKGGGAE